MALAVDFFAVVDEWQSNLLDFTWTEVCVQARLLWSLVRKYALRQWSSISVPALQITFMPLKSNIYQYLSAMNANTTFSTRYDI